MSINNTTYFQKSWLDLEQYRDWLAEDTKAKCNLCKKLFKLLYIAADALKSHADRERNKQEIKNLLAIRQFFDKHP